MTPRWSCIGLGENGHFFQASSDKLPQSVPGSRQNVVTEHLNGDVLSRHWGTCQWPSGTVVLSFLELPLLFCWSFFIRRQRVLLYWFSLLKWRLITASRNCLGRPALASDASPLHESTRPPSAFLYTHNPEKEANDGLSSRRHRVKICDKTFPRGLRDTRTSDRAKARHKKRDAGRSIA